MVPLRTVLAHPDLGLRLLTGDPLDLDVRWAHVSELDDPTPWLEGGELLLTTGLSASWDGDDALRYCQRLVERGVVALGVSVGSDLTHQTIPEALIAAAEKTGLRLILVPQRTPLQAVVRAVADAISAASAQPLRSLVDAQQRLMSEAASGSGLEGAAERLRAMSGLAVSVYDIRLRPVINTPDIILGDELSRRIRRQLLRDRQGAISIQEDAGRSMVVFPLVTEGRARGFAVSAKRVPFTAEERALLKVAAPVLGLLLDLRDMAGAPLRNARATLAAMLLAAKENSENLAAVFSAARVDAASTQVVCVRTQSVAQRRAFLAGLDDLAGDALVLNDQDQTTVILCDPRPDVFDRLSALIAELGLGDAGIGEAGPAERTPQSHTEAVRAQSAARTRGIPLATAPKQGHQLRRIFLADEDRLSEFSHGVLAPLEAHDQANPRHELLPTLRAYFDSIASIEASAVTMQIHRHTMRARLKRITELSGYDISDSSQYLELWLAVELRNQRVG
ncbi:PucR family transcriptional regulator [Microbacterium pseudoresistens]|uniref:Purine catabolism regulator n=1 Tax=Microbacterium pseudoresistens TaxID=640634 RepID=A0A7Y9EVF1_9MICO|nr:PucR family transcriptional regulator [Microbacterium pseudoresistens]NYD54633.1 purine catabolism regulator [Microbacterium pseudoresistens]